MIERVLGIVYLLVSASSAFTQTRSLVELRKDADDSSVHKHLMRTVVSRTILAYVYIGLAGVSLTLSAIVFQLVGLVVFSIAQLVWRANTREAIRFKRSLEIEEREHRDESEPHSR